MSVVDDVSDAMCIADSLSDIESVDETMQAGAAVATFSELEENAATAVLQECSTPVDLGISVWGGRYGMPFVTVLHDNTCCSLSCNNGSSNSSLPCKSHIDYSLWFMYSFPF